MADFTQTVSNSISVFGTSPSSLWGQMLWGDNWGEGSVDLITSTDKLIENAVTPDSAIVKDATHLIEDSVSVSSETSHEGLKDAAGYDYVFVSNTIEAEERDPTTWIEVD